MQKSLLCLLIVLTISACGGSGSQEVSAIAPVDPPVPGPTAAETFAADIEGLALSEFYFESYKALTSRSPELVLWRGLAGVFPLEGALLDNLSDDYQRDTFAMHQVALDGLRSYDRAGLSPEDQLHYDVYEWHLQDVVDRLEFIYYNYLATYSLFGVQNDTQTLLTDIHPMETKQDAEDYVSRLINIPTKFAQVSDHLLRQRDAGVVEPALTMRVAIDQMTQLMLMDSTSNPYYTAFATKIEDIADITSAEKQDLLNNARASIGNRILPAYQQLQQTMQGLLSSASPSIGVGQFPKGVEYYDYILRHHTTTSLTAAEIHQLGLNELARIHAEMRLLFDQLGYPQNESLQQLFARVIADGGVIPAADVFDTYTSLIEFADQNLDQAFDIFPVADVVVAPDDFGGYYIGPSFDGSRPGAFYAGTMTDQPWFQMPTLTFHESLPGHHMQIALAMEQDAPIFRKMIRVTAFVEGWGLYAERLAFELGWYDNDIYGNLGRLQFEALRANRLVIDTGIHHFGWSFDEAVRFNQENGGFGLGESQGAAARYSVIPGQATAYMIGMLQILEARQRAMDMLGQQFDLAEFHRVVLSGGAIPLALLDSIVDRYVSEKLGTP